MTEEIIEYSHGAIQYEDAKAIATKYCDNSKRKILNFTHVGDDTFAWSVAQQHKAELNTRPQDDMIYAVKVKPMNNYLLLIRFNNGEERVFNCCPLLEDNIYAELKDKDFFDSVYIDENGLVCWSESTDINPDYLYDNSEPVSNMTFETRIEGLGNNIFEKPTEQQTLLFSAVNRELKKRANNTLSEEERYMIVSNFVSHYDFTNTAIAHKSAGGWADMILSEIEYDMNHTEES